MHRNTANFRVGKGAVGGEKVAMAGEEGLSEGVDGDGGA